MSQLATIAEMLRLEDDRQRLLKTLKTTTQSFDAITISLTEEGSPAARHSRMIASNARERLTLLLQEIE